MLRSILCLATMSLCSEAGSGPAFEVASVKPDKSTTGVDRLQNSNGSLIIVNVALKRCIGLAYGIEDGRDYLLSGPEWLESERFDISAKYPPETPKADFQLMLQKLLEERFGLRTHHETREFAAYAMVVAKGGPKLQEAASPGAYRFSAQPGRATGFSISMPMLAARLRRTPFSLDRQVVDMTGLYGVYDFTLTWSPDGAASARPSDSPEGPSLFTAIQEQLGLKLEFRKSIPLDVLVIDHVERVPVAN